MRDTSDEEKTIMILLAARKFKYTRVAVLPEYQIDFPKRYWEMVEIVSMPEFKFYINGKYTPPIQAQPIDAYVQDPVFGTQWGIFAKDTIPK